MENRAVITTRENWKNGGVGVYLHWNGGMDSVEGFLRYCKLKGYRSPDKDSYGWARLCQVIGNFFGGTTSVGIDTLWHLDCDNGDNGVYIIEDWEIVDRYYYTGSEQNEYPLKDMLMSIDERMPEHERFGEEFLSGDPIPTEELKVGDKVFTIKYDGSISVQTVVGIGEDHMVNGTNVKGIPYSDQYNFNGNPAGNINNYLREKEYVRCISK